MGLFTLNRFWNSKKQAFLMPLHCSKYHIPSHTRNIIHAYNQSEQSITICSNKTHKSRRSSPVRSCALSPYPQVLQTHMHWFSRVFHHPELLSHQELKWNVHMTSSITRWDGWAEFWNIVIIFLILVLWAPILLYLFILTTIIITLTYPSRFLQNANHSNKATYHT